VRAPFGARNLEVSAILRLLDWLRRAFGQVVLVFNAAASAWIFVIMLLVTLDITLRFAFGGPLSGVTEIVEISIVVVLFLQMTHALKVGRITRSDALHSAILRTMPKLGHTMGALFNLAGVGLMVAIITGGWPKWLQAYEGGHYVGNVGVFTFPEWPQRLVLVIGCAAMAIQFFLLALDNVRGFFGKPPLETEAAVDVEAEAAERSIQR
jgi:TRAP-type mannitol/chloroaromatic compound transport system permease small subunit